MTEQERELDFALAAAEAENKLLRARNKRLEQELAEEREACAKIADRFSVPMCDSSADDIANLIRARGSHD